MATFPLSRELSSLHNTCLGYASSIQCEVAAKGGCQTLASEALNILMFNAVLAHRGIRTLCEEGWEPVAPIVARTMLDLLASCVAIVSDQANAEYMGFKYLSHFHHNWLSFNEATEEEVKDAKKTIETIISRLSPVDQVKAQDFIAKEKPKIYWFQPEYTSTKALLDKADHPIYGLYKVLSGITHGGFSSKLLFNDYPTEENIEPRAHPKGTSNMILASSRLLLETAYLRDHWENKGAYDSEYYRILAQLNELKP
jgi:hypothetical protein